MSEQRRFGESDHEPLAKDDILAEAIGQWKEELPSRDLWTGVSARIREQQPPVVATQRFFTFTIAQFAVAASLLIAVSSGLTWLVLRPPVDNAAANGPVIQAYGVPEEETGGQILQANFADAQFNAAVSD